MPHDTNPHGWRADTFTLTRDGWHAQVSRAWCEDDGEEECWTWQAWPLDGVTGNISDHDIPESVQRYRLTFGAAVAAVDAYIAAKARPLAPVAVWP